MSVRVIDSRLISEWKCDCPRNMQFRQLKNLNMMILTDFVTSHIFYYKCQWGGEQSIILLKFLLSNYVSFTTNKFCGRKVDRYIDTFHELIQIFSEPKLNHFVSLLTVRRQPRRVSTPILQPALAHKLICQHRKQRNRNTVAIPHFSNIRSAVCGRN